MGRDIILLHIETKDVLHAWIKKGQVSARTVKHFKFQNLETCMFKNNYVNHIIQEASFILNPSMWSLYIQSIVL
jgi:adenylate kinase family enzyme